MINFVFVYDLQARKTVALKPERKEARYAEHAKRLIQVAEGGSKGLDYRNLSLFDTKETGYSFVTPRGLVCIVTGNAENDTQRKFVAEFALALADRLRETPRVAGNREFRTFLKQSIRDYSKKINLARLFPQKGPVSSRRLEQEFDEWARLARAAPAVLEVKERVQTNTREFYLTVAGLAGAALLILLFALWTLRRLLSKTR